MLNINIKKTYNNFSLSINTKIPKGFISIVGPSGSGKTTLLECITGITKPNEGFIHILYPNKSNNLLFDKKKNINVSIEKRKISLVKQDLLLFPHMTVYENISYPLRFSKHIIKELHPKSLLQKLQLEEVKNKFPNELSGGQQQRTALARTLCSNPKILLLDEPLKELAQKLKNEIIGLLVTINRQLGIDIILVSHDISDVLSLSNHILILSNGKIIAQNTPAQLLTNPNINKFLQLPQISNFLTMKIISSNIKNSTTILKKDNLSLTGPFINQAIGKQVIVNFQSTDIIISTEKPVNISARNIILGKVETIIKQDNHFLVYLNIGEIIVAHLTTEALKELQINNNSSVYIILKTSNIKINDIYEN